MQFPYEGSVYDHWVDFECDIPDFKRWSEKLTEFKYDPSVRFFNILVPTEDTVKYNYMLELLMEGGFNTCISGETGTGKSVIIQAFLNQLNQEKFVNSTVNFSA